MIKAFFRLASSFRNKMILIFFAITIVPFILFASYAYMKSVEGIKTANTTFSMSYLEQAKINMEAYLDQLNDQINDLVGNKAFQQLLEKPPQSAKDEETFAVNMLSMVYQQKNQIDALQLHVYPLDPSQYPTYMRTMGEPMSVAEMSWFRDAKSKIVPTWHLTEGDAPAKAPRLTYVKTFTGLHDRNPRGIIAVDIAENRLSRFFSPTERLSGQKFLIVDRSGNVLFDSAATGWTGQPMPSEKLLSLRNGRSEGTATLEVGGASYLSAYVWMSSEPWTIVSLTPLKAMTKPVAEMNRLLMFFLVAYLICSVGVVIYLTRNFTQPVLRLVRLMLKLKEGDFGMKIPYQTRKDEIGWLYRGFDGIVKTIEGLIEQSTRAERNKKELEIQVLSHQINPHFLYNTLESIRWKAENHGRSDIGEMVNALGNLLRLSLNQGKDITTVGREIEQVKAYVLIEQARIGMPLRVLYFLDDEMLDMPFTRLLLQPLVENAIQHSIRGNFEKGKVILSGYVEERDIIIEVTDNGKGIPDSVLQQLEEETQDPKSSRRQGVGLRNVNERLKISFGPEYKLRIATGEGKGTKITIRHPILDVDGKADHEAG